MTTTAKKTWRHSEIICQIVWNVQNSNPAWLTQIYGPNQQLKLMILRAMNVFSCVLMIHCAPMKTLNTFWEMKLENISKLKEESIGPPKLCLGGLMRKWHWQWHWGLGIKFVWTCQKCCCQCFKKYFEEVIETAKSRDPILTTRRPELDMRPELDLRNPSHYWPHTGILR